MSIHTQADRVAGRAARWVVLAAALVFAAGAILGALSPRLATPPSSGEVRAWASVLAVPRVEADLSASESAGSEIRRVRLDGAATFRVEDVSDLDERSFAFIDGATARFQEFEPAEPGSSGRLVFKRNPRGGSLFVGCGPRTPCRDLVVVAHRRRLAWALRIGRMPFLDAFGASMLLLLSLLAAWRLRHSNRGALGAVAVAFSLAMRTPAPAMPPSWTDAPLLITLVLLVNRLGPGLALRRAGTWVGRRVSGFTVDLSLVLCLTGLGAVEAGGQMSSGVPLSYYEHEFGPAVNFALGRGLVSFSAEEMSRNPGLRAFLLNQSDGPGSLSLDAPAMAPPLAQFHRIHGYLILTVGWIWRTLGISHAALFIPWCFAVGLTVAAAFAFARAWLGRTAAAAVSLAFLYAPSTEPMILYPRDFVKATFVFLFLAAATRCAASEPEYRSGRWGFAAGLCLGIGSGFRMDLLASVPIFAVVLIVRRATGKGIIVPAAAFAFSALATAGPIVASLAGGSNSAHVALLGQSPYFDRQNDLYAGDNQWNAVEAYLDERLFALADVAAALQHVPRPRFATAAYDEVLGRLLGDQVRWAAADVAARVVRAQQILWEQPATPGNEPDWASESFRSLRSVWLRWAGWMWLAALAAAFVDRSGQSALLLSMLLAAVATSWLQLASRHIFHWLPVALTVQIAALWWLGSSAARLVHEKRRPRLPAWRALAVVIAFCAPAGVLELARWGQNRVRLNLASRLVAEPGVPVAPSATMGEDLIFPTALHPPAPGSGAYSVLTVDWSRCPNSSLDVEWGGEEKSYRDRYRLAAGPPREPGPTYLFHARAYVSSPTYFFVPAAFSKCVTVLEPPPRPDLPILWSIVLSPGWEKGDHNLRIADEMPAPDPAYSAGSLEPASDGTLRIAEGGQALLQGAWNTNGEKVGARTDYRQPGPRSQVFWSPFIVAGRSGRYRFEFEIDAPGGEWRAGLDRPSAPGETSETAVGDGSLAHPGALLLRPLRLNRRVVLDEWIEEGESYRLYLRALSSSGSASVSGFRVSRAPTSKDDAPAITRSEP